MDLVKRAKPISQNQPGALNEVADLLSRNPRLPEAGRGPTDGPCVPSDLKDYVEHGSGPHSEEEIAKQRSTATDIPPKALECCVCRFADKGNRLVCTVQCELFSRAPSSALKRHLAKNKTSAALKRQLGEREICDGEIPPFEDDAPQQDAPHIPGSARQGEPAKSEAQGSQSGVGEEQHLFWILRYRLRECHGSAVT